MARIKRKPASKDYSEARFASDAFGEKDDCAVTSVAIATGVPYNKVHALYAEKGRKPGRATPNPMTDAVLKELGYDTKPVCIQEIIDSFPKPHCNVLKNFTTHHPRRFPGCLDPDKVYLARTRGHILAIKGGEVHDWTVNSSTRVWRLLEVIKKPDNNGDES